MIVGVIRNNNNFDLLRLTFAWIVFLVHAATLTGAPLLVSSFAWLSSKIAIDGFFVMSGYLIFMSFDRSERLLPFYEKRIRRIAPAYLLVVFVATLGGVFLTSLPPVDYFGDSSTWGYFVANTLFLNFLSPTLPGLFEGNRMHEVNGALWTIKIEVMFYAVAPFIWMGVKRFGLLPFLGIVYLFSFGYTTLFHHMGATTGIGLYDTLARQLPGQLSYFAVGGALYGMRDRLRSGAWFIVGGGAYLLSHFDPMAIFYPAGWGIIVIGLATRLPLTLNGGRFGDLSYGVYLFHFPALQAMIAFGFFNERPLADLFICSLILLLLAFLSWHGVEKRFLARSSHYLKAEGSSLNTPGKG